MKKLIVLLLLTVSLFAGKNDRIKILTENYPPYNMKHKGKVKGLAVDVLKAMLKQMNYKVHKKEFLLTNWAQAYLLAKKKKNHMVFSTTRTQAREPLFKWVGPIANTTIAVIAPKNRNIKIKKISDLNKYRIGAVYKDVGQLLLLENNIDNMQIKAVGGKNPVKKLFKNMDKNEIDMFAYEVNVAKYIARAEWYHPSDYENVFTLKRGQLYFAFNKKTDDRIIKRWQKALDVIKKNGTYDKILKKY